MTEQSEQPVEETQVEQSNEPANLEEVVKTYNVEERASEVVQEPVQTPQPTSDYDLDSFVTHSETKQLNDSLNSVVQEFQKMKSEIDTERTNRDIKEAVAEVNKITPADPTMTEILLEKKYREDQNFKKIWDNRYGNPQALKAALKVIATDAGKLFNVQADPQLSENVRAAKKSQNTSARTPEPDSLEDKAMNMSPEEFDNWWATFGR